MTFYLTDTLWAIPIVISIIAVRFVGFMSNSVVFKKINRYCPLYIEYISFVANHIEFVPPKLKCIHTKIA